MGNTASHYPKPPISNFPPELMEIVFELACEDYKMHVRRAIGEIEVATRSSDALIIKHTRREHTVTPGTISLVCRAWKELAYNTPVLWNTSLVDVGHLVSRGQASTNLQSWLNRAGKSPLTVKIVGVDVAIKPLFEHVDQWKWIDICCLGDCPEMQSELEKIMRRPPPLLETFIYRPSLHCALYGDEGHPIFSVGEATPNLTQIAKFQELPLLIPLSRIKVCGWDRVGTFTILRNLQEMDRIAECFIYSPGMRFIVPPLPPFIRLLHLKDLTLHSLRFRAFEYPLPSLELPALQRLTCSNIAEVMLPQAYGTVNLIKLILSLLQRSGSPNIQYLDLKISALYLDANELLNILRIVPELKEFKFALKPFSMILTTSMLVISPGADPVILCSLTLFDIDLSSLQDLIIENSTAFFKYLSVPALKEFYVALPARKSENTLQVVDPAALEFLIRSCCPLVTLKINFETRISETALVNLLKATPSLECLHLIGQGYNRFSHNKVNFTITDKLFEVLLPQYSNQGPSREDDYTIYLPRLSEISLEGTVVTDPDVVLRALEYRCQDHTTEMRMLSRFRLYDGGTVMKKINEDEKLLHRYRVLLLSGMDVLFRGAHSRGGML